MVDRFRGCSRIPTKNRNRVCIELWEQYENGKDDFLARIVTGDKTWLHNFEPENWRQSMEYQHANSLNNKKFKKTASSAGKVMATVLFTQTLVCT